MVNAKDRTAWKAGYFVKIAALLNDYPKCFIVKVDNVGSKQMQQIRMSLRGTGVILMGKNTMMRKAIRAQAGENPQLDKLMPHLKGNVGFVFTREDLIQVREKIQSNKVEAPAKAGALAPCDVVIPGQNTGLGPEKTSFFQALQIQTKISKGTIEMLADVHLIKKGDKVGASEAALLNMLKISPFTYGLEIEQVYDSGTVFEPSVLDITQEDLRSRFMTGVRRIAAISIAIGRPTMAAVPHMIANGFKNVLAIAVVTDITFKEAEKVKEYLKDPSKFASAVAAAPAAPAGKQDAKAAPAKKEEAKPESEDEGDGDMGLGLFD